MSESTVKALAEALEQIAWSNDSAWQSQCAREALASLPHPPQPADGASEFDITLEGLPCKTLLAFLAPDPETGECGPLRLQFGHGHSGRGLYLSAPDYPEDGAEFIAFIPRTPAPPHQPQSVPPPPMGGEPVAWVCTDYDGHAGIGFTKNDAKADAGEDCNNYFPLYTHPAAPTPSAPAAVGEGERWLVEEVGENGNSTGRYMLDQTDLTITDDPNKARGFLRRRTAQFRAEDMREKHGTAWRTAQHVFIAAAPQAQEGGQR